MPTDRPPSVTARSKESTSRPAAMVTASTPAPAGTPAPVVARIHALTQGMMKDEAAKKAMAGAGLDLMTMSQPEFAGFVKAEYARWEKIVKNAGVEKQ